MTGDERRRRWSDEERSRILAAIEEPGAVAAEVARHADICMSLVYKWRREARATANDPGFAQVVVENAPRTFDASRRAGAWRDLGGGERRADPDRRECALRIPSANRLKAPIVHAFRGKEHIEWDNPFDVGMTGLIGFSSGYYAMLDCDVLLMLGTDFPYRQLHPRGARVQIGRVDMRPANIGRARRVEKASN